MNDLVPIAIYTLLPNARINVVYFNSDHLRVHNVSRIVNVTSPEHDIKRQRS